MNDQEVRRGAGIYSKPVLGFYDLLVVKFSNSLAWRCASQLMLDQYNRCIGLRHLDVGPGTGWYLAKANLPKSAEITLMDLNENTLEHAASRLAHSNVSTRGVTGNVLEPIPEALGQFESIAANYVFHCVPGSWEDKGAAFEYLGERLADDGVLFGSTILGRGVNHNLIGRGFMALYNRMGIFHNREDDAAGLEAELRRSFRQVSVDVVGTVAVFSAREPLRKGGAGGLG
ncbi:MULTISPECIES: bifunctional 2-polyprenyl-6-hydroxyphenol methylase/3-demethylubiquinol 3-O-methyltransferase UbiG [Paenarthrobacter]|uniref:Class I SAM-dependent methyltransferase n=1 Tax=Paenarthrobacter ureafaciens TaxID=37931 RepID=A0AAX3EEG3_PAEUR|nr:MULTISPECIES: class I SAM-dependent methyltransferase [Paenarthrobacter]NKR13304.1 hypothetical protein [Arthrobacter sp. M5]NKR14846.1 hypothetical protein [Arthrobacter sp. M6]OEH62398.1 hypothetical protein A5N13_01705 [Arthrobacter sp. D4]OEH62969.1 hypothetical protein A5N17_09945 [Arthrobacter sp. D2]MDO5865145.1 class I SAM-dependent methyltransferase [Paenarthrobacter sp. SD-2]